MGVLPGEMDWMQKSWCEENPCKCAAGGKWSDVYASVPDRSFCKNSGSHTIPKPPVVIPTSPTSTKPSAEKSSGINFGLIALLAAVLL